MPRPYRRKSSTSKRRVDHDPNTQRINKVLAAAGLGSRRDVEELIVQGRVEVDGETVTNLATRVDPKVSKIVVDGTQLKRQQLVYYALNKPKGILSTNNDPSGRPRVIDFVPARHRVFSVGRLDRYSEGLMLLTNDGDIAQRLAHPRFRVQKTYFVVVAGLLTLEELAKLKKGVYLAEGMARIDGARIRKARKTYTELEILLSEGKNREIRRILARAGHKVLLLRRIAIGPLRLAELPVGAVRELTPHEVKALYVSTEPKKQPAASAAKGKRTTASSDEAPAKTKVVAEKIVTPLETGDFDDFGSGLEQDYQYDESALTPSDDAIEFGGGEEEDWDDDFVADFESLSSGSVLGYGDDEAEEPSEGSRPARKPNDRDSGRRDSARSSRGGDRAAAGPRGKSANARTGGNSRTGGRKFSKKAPAGSREGATEESTESTKSRFSKGKAAGKPVGKRSSFKGARSASTGSRSASKGSRSGNSEGRSFEGRSTEGRSEEGRKPSGRRSSGRPGGKPGAGGRLGKPGSKRKPRG
jgi:23S rRNA pseudouridine2605 synthase